MNNSSFLLLSAADVVDLMDPATMMESQRIAFRELALGRTILPRRLVLDGPAGSTAFCYAARTSPEAGAVCKFGSVNPGNAAAGAPTISATIVVLDPMTGMPAAMLDGTAVTTWRTAAATAVAVEALADTDGAVVAIIGAGVQGAAHATALAHAFDLTEIRLTGPHPDAVQALAATLDAELACDVRAAATTREAVKGAAIVVCCTTSSTPVVEVEWLDPRATVVSIGSFTADRHEVSQELVRRAVMIVVDHLETALEHAGPVVEAVRTGDLVADQVVEIGDVLVGGASRQAAGDGIVYYNSVGVGAQDAAAAETLSRAAVAGGHGRRITM